MSIYSDNFERAVKSASILYYVFWFATTLPVVLFLLLTFILPTPANVNLDPYIIEIVFPIIAGIFLASSFLIRSILSSDSRLTSIVKSEELNNGTVNLESERERKLYAVVRSFIIPTIVSLALSEAVAVIGFLIFLMSGNREQALIYFAIAFSVNLMSFPKTSRFITRGEAILNSPNT